MEIVDLQLHEPAAFLAWEGAGEQLRRDVTKEALLQMTDAVGVDAVLIHPAEGLEFAEQLSVEHPRRFASAPMVTGGEGIGGVVFAPGAPDVEERIADVVRRPGVVALRFTPSPHFYPGEFVKLETGGYDRALSICEREEIPVLLMICGRPEAAAPIAARFPGLQLILDHIGLPQAPMEEPDEPPWKRLDDVLGLARYPNVAVKLSACPALSTQPFPFTDIWPHIHALIDAFGVDRVAWASDIGRVRGRVGWTVRVPGGDRYVGRHTYMESLAFFLYSEELSPGEKEKILGQNARRLLKWPSIASAGDG